MPENKWKVKLEYLGEAQDTELMQRLVKVQFQMQDRDENWGKLLRERLEKKKITLRYQMQDRGDNCGEPLREHLEKWQKLLQEQLESTKSSVYAEKLPKGTSRFLNNEELQAYCIEYRQAWYGDKSLNLRTHLMVWLKTWQFVLVEIIGKQLILVIKQRFKPLYKTRLPKQ